MNLNIFNTANLFEAATNLFQQLNIKLNSNTAEPLPVKDLLKQHYKDNDTFKTIGKTYFIGIIDNTVFQATGMFDINYSYKEALQQGDKNYDGLMLFALELSKQPTRTEISDLTRTFNRISQKMPVALVLKYKTGDEACFSIAISERFKFKQNWRQGEKAGKVIILRDIHSVTTHAGHERILLDLVKPVGVNNYDQLHQHWLQVLDVNILNKKFFQDLANWYFWAMDNVSFPDDLEKKKDVRNATNLIRLITRVVFIWFIKEKSLVPNALFNKSLLDKILKDFNKNKKSQNYYHAILQNLFFGTLNQKMDERKFAKDGGNIKTNGEEYGVKNLFRYADLFTISEKEAMQLFKDVPFLNGGLFDCLDKPNEEGKIVYVDGFSRNTKKQAVVPDYIFFGEEREVDLNDIFATKNKKYKSRGLINLLESYKFTVAENTPIEEEIALDPELLGKVFENLLASYNPETQTTARKQTGSFYTPREIVNYMVDESLLEYIKQNVKIDDSDFETRLRELISYAETPNPFDEAETKALIEAINNCKILDPACGSGAYPMGILHKMVHLLQKLDPENKYWKALQRQKALEGTETAFKIGDKEERGKRLAEINDVFENNASDYGRKLYLIENCIYGIDIQPIAVQISKLRFFISLIIDQNKQATKENFGIRSLPNLETKFVAANTLIGLDKPAQTLLRNPEIEVKENQLKELRHKYFTANTRKEKLNYQTQDKKLRLEIAKMLESDGWQTAVAKQIVAFDPYDQNKFANWFEAEWMFGSDVDEGFDIIIGNPPWGAKLLAEEKELFKKTYPKIDSSTPNTFSYFVGWAFKNYRSVASFVLPDSILIKDFAKTRDYIKDFVSEIIWYENTGTPEQHKQFIYVDHDVCVINIFKRKSLELKYSLNRFDRNENKLVELKYNQAKLKIILEEFEFAFNLIAQEKDFNLLSKFSKFDKLDDFMQCHEGIHTGNSREILFLEKPKNKFCKPLFYGGGAGDIIQNYYSKTAGWYVDYRSDIIDKSKGYYASLRDERIFKNPKIYITRTGNPFKAFYDESTYASNNFFSLQHIDYSKNNPIFLKFILPFIISKPAQYFIRTFAAPRLGSTFIETKIFHLLKFRIPKIEASEQLPFTSIVDYIVLQKSVDIDTTFLERLVDAMVYELYLPAEIKLGGAEVLKHLGNIPELIEGQDEKNLKTIEKVYKELSDPKHPISAALLKLLTIEEVNIIEGRK
ncbi:Eco57I restriction-modification methylase domain-containing protein [Algoriphagus sp. A40]|uniref:Eco57I restriction-modification methylase domain-containing protein n=1 Tax=Algoriphagus sp. A40 TaxID=1945863 RepID=UPI000987ABD6|nr:TaqI-like C-terminal specificity domain-containing protein [Algoriphagus sp. A40]OOG75325.1 hypothetical protein B0E43_10105 [Algoriphagus sp. A40]